MNNSDYQQELQLIHQLQTHTLSVAHSYLLLLFALPLPIHWKLAIYHFFTTLPFPPLSPMATTIIILVAPIFFLLCMYLLIKLLIALIKAIIPFVLTRFKKTKEEKIFLELTFPSDTDKSAYATEQLYSLLHALAKQKGFWGSFLQIKNQYSLEIVSTKNEGIRYILVADGKATDVIKRSLVKYKIKMYIGIK